MVTDLFFSTSSLKGSLLRDVTESVMHKRCFGGICLRLAYSHPLSPFLFFPTTILSKRHSASRGPFSAADDYSTERSFSRNRQNGEKSCRIERELLRNEGIVFCRVNPVWVQPVTEGESQPSEKGRPCGRKVNEEKLND